MEIFDICDEQGLPTGETVERSEAHRLGICHRTAHIWVVRKSESGWEILLQKRARGKDSFPGRFDTSSSGHIQAGDEPLPSAQRELFEELGIAAKESELEPMGTFRVLYEKEFHGKVFKDNEIAYIFLYRQPVETEKLVLQTEEVECVEWFDIEEVRAGVAVHDMKFCVPRESLQKLYEHLCSMNICRI